MRVAKADKLLAEQHNRGQNGQAELNAFLFYLSALQNSTSVLWLQNQLLV